MNTNQAIVGAVNTNTGALLATGVTVAVIAWQSTGGAGFDWYFSPSAADVRFAIEKKECDELSGREAELTMVRFDVTVSSYENAEREIDAQLDELFVQVENPYPRKPSFMSYPERVTH
ncbi:hypothetical protein [Burkholderia sp. Ac-20365]|uniref:hypothetical protein n=1 Tax=Burkholderia sp. Ac-20365 TaxID=2703897 RepID=UPI00197B3687|nr:hypothetical protein [Burkholderia sp. Ac-20365]MBN3760915.1 hypothetical protein [Burkholderia sp. Ac-20365]